MITYEKLYDDNIKYVNMLHERLFENHQKRYIHSINVSKVSYKLGVINNLSDEMLNKLFVSSILHDYLKYLTKEDYLKCTNEIEYYDCLHALCFKYFIDFVSSDIIDIITYHATGKDNMNILQKILYVSDYIEESRIGESFDEVRKIAYVDIDKACFLTSKYVLLYLLSKEAKIHPLTLKTYNYYKI